MVQTSQMPKSIHSGISIDAVGEALLQHYNVGIKNPWYEIGLSDQETYNRRKLPWAGKTYSVVNQGGQMRVVGQTGDASDVPEGLKASWKALAQEANSKLNVGEGGFGDLETMYEEGLSQVSPDPDQFAPQGGFKTR